MTNYSAVTKEHFSLLEDMGWELKKFCFCEGSWKEQFKHPLKKEFLIVIRPERNLFIVERYSSEVERGKLNNLINCKNL